MAVLCFVCWYFPTGLYRNAYPTDSVDSRGVTVLLFIWLFLMFTSTFANMIIAGFDSDEVAGGLVTLIMVMIFSFCGYVLSTFFSLSLLTTATSILSPPQDLPGFWMFMYRVNPFTYVVEGLLSTSMANAQASCESNEFIKFTAPNNTTCGAYLKSYIDTAGGYVNNPADGNGAECQYCTISDTNTFLSSLGVSFDNRWRDFGFMWVYILFNIAAALGIYWLARVPKTRKTKKE